MGLKPHGLRQAFSLDKCQGELRGNVDLREGPISLTASFRPRLATTSPGDDPGPGHECSALRSQCDGSSQRYVRRNVARRISREPLGNLENLFLVPWVHAGMIGLLQ